MHHLLTCTICLTVPLEIVVRIYDAYDNNLVIKNDFAKYLKKRFFANVLNDISS